MGGNKVSRSVGIHNSELYGSCDLDPMTLTYEYDLKTVKTY